MIKKFCLYFFQASAAILGILWTIIEIISYFFRDTLGKTISSWNEGAGFFLLIIVSIILATIYALHKLEKIVEPPPKFKGPLESLLMQVKHQWIEGFLENSLYNEVLIQLGKERSPRSVEHPWSMIQEQPPPKGIINKKIIAVFNDSDKSLLILGEPGSGKTTTLLELARELIISVQNNNRGAIPVVFNLSSWANKQLPFISWLIEEFNTRYHIPKRFVLPWVEKNRVILLLDGLDEVRKDVQTKCVEAINKFRLKYGLLGIAVCSRIADYENMPKLKLSVAVKLEPLTLAQVYDYLNKASPRLNALFKAIKKDENLQDLAKSPLMLSIMSLAYDGKLDEGLSNSSIGDKNELQKNLFDNYVIKMLGRNKEKEYKRKKIKEIFSDKQTIGWLSWLAQNMVYHEQTEFLIEQIQPSWLLFSRERQFYLISFIFIYTFLCTLICGFMIVPYSKLFPVFYLWLIGSAIVVIVLDGLLSAFRNIETGEILSWSPQKALRNDLFWFRGFLIWGLIIGWLDGSYVWKNEGPIIGVLHGLSDILGNGLIGLLIGGLETSALKKKNSPNQGVKSTLKNAAKIGIIAAVISLLWQGLFLKLGKGRYDDLMISNLEHWGLPYRLVSIFNAVAFGLLLWTTFYGGKGIIKHYLIRIILHFKKMCPLNFVRFLDYAVKLIFMRRVGGGYIFVHRLLLEHFALNVNQSDGFDGVSNERTRVFMYNRIARICGNLGKGKYAIRYYQRILFILEKAKTKSLFGKLKNKLEIAVILNTIAGIYDNIGEYDEAIKYYLRVLPYWEELGNGPALLITLVNLIRMHENLGKREQATQYYERVLSILEEHGGKVTLEELWNKLDIPTTFNVIIQIEDKIDDPELLTNYYLKALSYWEEVGNWSAIAKTLEKLGSTYYKLGNYQQAILYYEQLIPIIEEVGDKPHQANVLNGIGKVYDKLEKISDALDCHQKAFSMFSEINEQTYSNKKFYRGVLARSRSYIGGLYVKMAQYEEAFPHLQSALIIQEESDDHVGEINTRLNIITIFYSQKNYQEATNHLRKVVELDQQISSPDLQKHKNQLAEIETTLQTINTSF